MNETQPIEPQTSAPVDPVEEKARQLSADAEYLAGMDRSQLSPEDQTAYDELVAHRKADYQANAEAIRSRASLAVSANNGDLQERLRAKDHNVR